MTTPDQTPEEEKSPPPHGYAPGVRDPRKSSGGDRSNAKLMTGFAVGIGSAAIVAALLYAGRRKARDKAPEGKKRPVEPRSDA